MKIFKLTYIIVFSRNVDTRRERLVSRLPSNNLKIKPSKCEFLKTEKTNKFLCIRYSFINHDILYPMTYASLISLVVFAVVFN